MTNNSDIAVRREDPAWARARARATAQRDFLVHLVIYVLVNTQLYEQECQRDLQR